MKNIFKEEFFFENLIQYAYVMYLQLQEVSAQNSIYTLRNKKDKLYYE
jgi:hypothetical protein